VKTSSTFICTVLEMRDISVVMRAERRRKRKQHMQGLRRALRLDNFSPTMRKVLVGVLGGAVLLAGLAMIVLPGPAFLVVPLGLAILAMEFNWAQRWWIRARAWARNARLKILRRKDAQPG
jgi:uncharacterized protein (TIGR02611 family)